MLINTLVSRTNIVDLINKRIPLKKQGSNFIACCPFHSEQFPSFTVNFEKQFYYCFGCGAHGNVINFLIQHDRLTFIESIQILSSMHGINITDKLYLSNNNITKHNFYQFTRTLCTYYQNNLKKNQYLYVYKYLKNRGLTDHSIDLFNIGFSPIGWNNISKNIDLKPYDQNLIKQSGVWIECNNKKNKYDRFRNRIMFPMKDQLGRIIGFGGRIFSNEKNKQPKYLNSPDTNFFKKKKNIYTVFMKHIKNTNTYLIFY